MRALAVLSTLALVFACSSATKAPEKLCTPGNYVFCRCQDRQEGTKLCNADAQSFGRCEPCETATNPEVPIEPGDPGSKPADAGDDYDPDPPPPACGNGVADPGEDCDDKNLVETDGCSHDCKLAGEAPPLSNSCGGLPVHVWGGEQKPSLVVTTAGAGGHESQSDCSGTKGAGAPDRVFQVTAHRTGTMTVATTAAEFDAVIYVSTSCSTTTIHTVACANATSGLGDETLQFDVMADKKYFVFVDGAAANAGKIRVTFSID